MATNKDSKVSVSALDKLLDSIDTNQAEVAVEIGDVVLEVKVDRQIPIQAFCDMVQEAADSYFQLDDEGQEHYVAGLGDFACSYVMLKYMTNLKTAVDVQNVQKQNDRLYMLCSNTDLVEKVEGALPARFVANYHDAVYEQVEFHKQEMLSNERQLLLDCATKIDKASTSFAQFIELFQGVDPQKMMDMMGRITSMSEEKLGEAVVDSRDKDFMEQQVAHLEVVK